MSVVHIVRFGTLKKTKVRRLHCSGWRICLSWLPCPLNNSKLSGHRTSLCHYSYGCAESRQSDLETKNLYFNQADALYNTCIPDLA